MLHHPGQVVHPLLCQSLSVKHRFRVTEAAETFLPPVNDHVLHRLKLLRVYHQQQVGQPCVACTLQQPLYTTTYPPEQ